MLFHVDGTTDREVAQKTVGLSKCDVNTLTVHLLGSRPHEPTSIMANAQRKMKIELGGHGYHTVVILV